MRQIPETFFSTVQYGCQAEYISIFYFLIINGALDSQLVQSERFAEEFLNSFLYGRDTGRTTHEDNLVDIFYS